MSTRPTPRPDAPVQRPNPIQNFQWKKEDFASEGGMGRINTQMQQLITAVQALQGTAGPTLMPSGINVNGARVAGLGAPEHPDDAISSSHAAGNFSPAVVSPQLDLGGDHALKGLTILQSQASQASTAIKAIQAILAPGTGVSGTVTLIKLTGGGANGHLTFVNGIITAFLAPT